jgi:DNA-binding CsgD family transcriptional regulator
MNHTGLPFVVDGEMVVNGVRYFLVRVPEQAPAASPPRPVATWHLEEEDEARAPAKAGFGLTRRELEVAFLIAEGNPNKLVADRLGISTNTVSTYLRRIFGKVSADNRAQMVAKLAGQLERMKQSRRRAG